MEIGEVYGRLTVLQLVPVRKALVKCECGTEKLVQRAALKNGQTRSCGCLAKELAAERLRRRHQEAKE